VAAKVGNSEVLKKLWECAKEKITADELNNKMLIAKDDKEYTAWHVTAMILAQEHRRKYGSGAEESNPRGVKK
jgi:hypothetical protein